MNAMIVSLLINIDMSIYKLNIGDASHRIKPSPDGASLVQATLAHWTQKVRLLCSRAGILRTVHE